MRIVDVLMTGMRIRSRNHIHPELPAPRNDVAECVHGPEPSASIVERNLSWIKSDNASRAQAGRIGMNALEVVEPEREVAITGIVFDECQLGPAHRAVIPSSGTAVGCAHGWRNGTCFGDAVDIEAGNAGCGKPGCLLDKSPSAAPHLQLLKSELNHKHVDSVLGRRDHCVGSITFIPDASSGFLFRGTVFTVTMTSNVGFT